MSQSETNFLIRKIKYRFLTFSTYFVGEQDSCAWAEESQSDLRSLSFFNFILSLASSVSFVMHFILGIFMASFKIIVTLYKRRNNTIGFVKDRVRH